MIDVVKVEDDPNPPQRHKIIHCASFSAASPRTFIVAIFEDREGECRYIAYPVVGFEMRIVSHYHRGREFRDRNEYLQAYGEATSKNNDVDHNMMLKRGWRRCRYNEPELEVVIRGDGLPFESCLDHNHLGLWYWTDFLNWFGPYLRSRLVHFGWDPAEDQQRVRSIALELCALFAQDDEPNEPPLVGLIEAELISQEFKSRVAARAK
jgi:hypothetical protein